MVNGDLRNIFGLAITASYIRTLESSSSQARLMCEAFAQGFGLSTTEGDSIYSYFLSEGHPELTEGFFLAPYTTYEQTIRDIIDGFLPEAPEYHRQIITIAAHAMIFAYTINSSIDLIGFNKLLGELLFSVAVIVLDESYFRSINNVIIHPFSVNVLKGLIINDYSSIISYVKASPKTIEAPLTNYNWYDVSTILAGPNLRTMKDVENQYYYLSGVMSYEGAYGTVETCIEDIATITSWSGDATFSYIRNVPCRDSNTYVGPVDYVKFNRIFNDGPSSSGYFEGTITGFYINNDKSKLETGDYSTNSFNLTPYTGGNSLGSVFVEPNGRYSIEYAEYKNAPYSYACAPDYQRMHIGDNRPRYICDENTCSCSRQVVTGFKFASLELPNEIWNFDLQFRQTNPISDLDRVRKRAWNVTDNPYLATADGEGILWPYTKDFANNEYWYVGYPILNGVNDIPQISFFQTFDSPTFGDSASLVMYPSIGSSDGDNSENSISKRDYKISTMQLFSGESNGLPIKFNITIPSNLSGQDPTAQKFFGMGTAFSGKYDVHTILEENAGFFYTGFNVSSDGVTINSVTLADSFQDSIIGKYKTIKYISGYKRKMDGATYGLSNKFAKNSSGDIFTYSYFSQSETPAVMIQEDNWSYFAQVPDSLEVPAYERVYEEQTVENYFPRFYDGPFSVETRKFLYPNAKAADKSFQGKIFGIPTGVSFKIRVREEAVKEIYAKFEIYADAGTSDNPTYVPVIRSDIPARRTAHPIMKDIFQPEETADGFDYNFNTWDEADEFSTSAKIGELVDNNWAPNFTVGEDTYVPVGKNSNVYNTSVGASYFFKLGLKPDMGSVQKHITYTASSPILSYSRAPTAEGLFHAFKYLDLPVTLTYTTPIFDLALNAVSLNDAIKQAFPIVLEKENFSVFRYQGNEDIIKTGQDPLFFEYIGGRRGGPLAEQEGGYHKYGIIGDRWNGIAYETYGMLDLKCHNGTSYDTFTTARYPANDVGLLLFNTAISGTELWTNGLSFSPYRKIRNTTPIDVRMKYPYSYDGYQDELQVWQSGSFINFDLGQFFPLKVREGSASDYSEQWYYQSGLRVGPFDRDVELGLSRGEFIGAYSNFFINGQILSHWFREGVDCTRDWPAVIGSNRIIQCGQPSFNHPRRDEYTILAVIPSGEMANINIKSEVDPALFSHDPSAYSSDSKRTIGLPSGVILSMRTHVPLDAIVPDVLVDSGELGRLSPEYYVGNGIPSKYVLNHPEGLLGLNKTFEFVNLGFTGKLYPKPDEVEFAKLAVKDSFNNLNYPKWATVEHYWQLYAMKNQVTIPISGYREASRVSFQIYDIQFKFDKIQYQSYRLVVPSGNCFLSGEMGYHSQADNTVFTEGVNLINATIDDELAETYNPSYASDVLKRIPAELFKFPTSEFGETPVLVAPSVMKQRMDASQIFEGQEYYYLSKVAPYNYNKLLWPALSDLETLNPGETIESIPPGDGFTFSNSTMLFSASQGQHLPNGLANPDIRKTYYVQDIFQTYDSVATDSSINFNQCITSGRGVKVSLSQGDLFKALVPRGTPLVFIASGLI